MKLPVQLSERVLLKTLARGNLEGRFKGLYEQPEFQNRQQVWNHSIDIIGKDTDINLLEFGVFKGNSMRHWVKNYTNPNSTFHGFDSFEGLPHDWVGKMIQGTFDVGKQTPDINDPRVNFHVGWIQNTLPEFLKQASLPKKTHVIHIDVDIYSASLFVLTTLWHYLDEFYVLFDEFTVDENLSFAHFNSAYPLKFEFFGYRLNKENLPTQVVAKVSKVPYKI